MDGLINLFKPVGLSSAQSVYRVRRITGQRKSGHAGTLDPAADGVLLVCLGRATKLVERLMDQPKVYRATARLDVTSESFDSDRPLLPVPVKAFPSGEEVRAAAAAFEGQIQQVPPAVSALKVSGVPAYELARRGKTVELKARTVCVYWLVVRHYDWPVLSFEMACGRGTYVRALIRDWGVRLGVGGCLTSLTRVAVGPFHHANSWTLERLEPAHASDYLLGIDEARAMTATSAPPARPRTVSDDDVMF
ncbi:tRNA pseudouridine synthase B [Phycisphaerae bacterium RAS1]|nr:tRNA pseudouridine synthase B [Phycisphaerae bacterium RAS1]